MASSELYWKGASNMLENDFLQRRIECAGTVTQLRLLREEFQDSMEFDANTLWTTERLHAINELHDAFIRSAIRIAEVRVRAAYSAAPPVSSFAYLLFGSGGRKEQTLWSDQDNGIVYVPHPDAAPGEAEQYMYHFSNEVQRLLIEIGYPPCDGNVLATNALWRKPLQHWKRDLREWITEPKFETVRYLLITSDLRAVYGDAMLARELKEELHRLIRTHREILPRMLQNTLRYKMLIGVLGNLLTEQYGIDTGGIDIKYGAYIPMVNAIRLLALSNGIQAASTLERIEALKDMNTGIRQSMIWDWQEAFQSVLKFRLMTTGQSEGGTFSTRGMLPGKQLTKEVKRELKHALRIGTELQKVVRRHVAII